MATKTKASAKGGLQFSRRFTRDDVKVFDMFEYALVLVAITKRISNGLSN